jgi:DNA-binding transcriptional ArsR family regulator
MNENNSTDNFSLKKIEILKAIAHPARLRILAELTQGVKCVSDFEDAFGMRQPAVSHHLSILRRYDLVDYFVDGRLKCYFLKDPMIPEIIEVLRKEHTGDLPAPACCPVTRKGKYPGTRNTKQAEEQVSNHGGKALY